MNQNIIKTPAIFLSFDDHHIDNWHRNLEFFEKNNMKVTFYICYPHKMKDEAWDKIKEIQLQGHTIGFHGLNHQWAVRALAKYGCQQYLDHEIDKGLNFFKDQDIKINHFSYPFGNRTTETDNCLFKRFSILRSTVFGKFCKYSYNITELPKLKLVFSKSLKVALRSYRNLIGQKNVATFLYSHSFNDEAMNMLLSISKQSYFYSMESMRCM